MCGLIRLGSAFNENVEHYISCKGEAALLVWTLIF